MDDRLHVLNVLLLIKSDGEGDGVLYVAKTTVGESEPLNLQLQTLLESVRGPIR